MKFNDSNYLAWKFQVLCVIHGLGLEEHIEENPKISHEFLSQSNRNDSEKGTEESEV